MKKTTSKPAGGKKPAASKKAPAKKSPAKPKRNASADMALLVEILDTNFSRLNNNDQDLMRAVERHAKITGRLATATDELVKTVRKLVPSPRALPPEAPQPHTDEHSDDMEVAGRTEEAPEE